MLIVSLRFLHFSSKSIGKLFKFTQTPAFMSRVLMQYDLLNTLPSSNELRLFPLSLSRYDTIWCFQLLTQSQGWHHQTNQEWEGLGQQRVSNTNHLVIKHSLVIIFAPCTVKYPLRDFNKILLLIITDWKLRVWV